VFTTTTNGGNPGSSNLPIIIIGVVGGVVLIAVVTVCIAAAVLSTQSSAAGPGIAASPAAVSSRPRFIAPRMYSTGYRGYYNNGYYNNQCCGYRPQPRSYHCARVYPSRCFRQY